MKHIYLDNAATTPIAKEVIKVMYESMNSNFGNPSSTHQFGRTAKNAVESARKNIASCFHVSASEIIFTAGGTEADNLILFNAVRNLGVTRIITSKIEHHAVLHVAEELHKEENVQLDFVNVDVNGVVDLDHLETLLVATDKKTLVSLMFVNNEIGTILPLKKVSDICVKHNALFHSDTVQGIGHYHLDLKEIPVDFITASAHKFHGPKGVGFAYFKKGFGIKPLLYGGSQEKGARSSTENVHSIIGMDTALSLAIDTLEKDKLHMNNLKTYFKSELMKLYPEVKFNGLSGDLDNGSCTILSVLFPFSNDMFLFNLDLKGIAVSGGSACQSGSNKGSHVLNEILNEKDVLKTSVRFSFSRYTTKEEIKEVVGILK